MTLVRSRNLPLVRRLIPGLAMMMLVAACTGSGQTETAALADSITPINAEVNNAVADLFRILDQSYDNRSQLYERLTDIRLPAVLAVLHDKAQRVDAPPGTEAELDRYVDFLGELLLASEALDLAIATEDPTATAIAAVTFEVSIGALAVSLPPESCLALTPQRGDDLCDPGDLSGYEASLGFEIRRFVASFRPAFRVPDTFGPVIRGRVLGTLQGEAALVLESAASRIGTLDPGTAYRRLHDVLMGYFPAAETAWAQHEADVSGADPLVYDFIVDSLDDLRTATQQLLEEQHALIAAALPDTRIGTVTGLWFSPSTE
jgi:hypothetical protein